MMRDEKLVGVAVRSKQPIERVLWVWGAILESASEINDEGRFELDVAEVAYFLRADEVDICAITGGLEAAERLASSRVVKWNNRQYVSDKSVARQAAFRERQKGVKSSGSDNLSGISDVTPPSRDVAVTAQDTDTDTDTEIRKKEPKKVLSKEKRGTRLSDDFEPDGTCWSVAEDMILTPRQSQTEFEKFKDYWKGKAGAAGVKLDWQATFRNWLRNSKGNSNGNYQTSHKHNSIAGNLEIANAAIDAALEREAQREASISAEYGENNIISLPRL